MAFIYRITNLINGKKYIGETALKDPSKRWQSHLHAIREGRGCPLLRKAVEKYGADNFKFEVICECKHEERYEKEKEWIASENSITPNGYNVLKGGAGGGFVGKKHSEETIAKMREATISQFSKMSKERKIEIYKNRRKTERKVDQYSLDNIKIATFESLKIAGITINVHPNTIYRALVGSRKTAGGYIWKYTD